MRTRSVNPLNPCHLYTCMPERSKTGLQQRTNTALYWVFVLVLAGAGVESVFTFDLVWAGVCFFLVFLAVLPLVKHNKPGDILPWEVVFLAAMPVWSRALQISFLSNTLSTYFSLAALGLVISVELDTYTAVKMTPRFAVFFAAVSTIAFSGFFTVVQWLSDLYRGTFHLVSLDAVMWNFVAVAATGLIGGIIFDAYFRTYRRGRYFT